MKTLTIQLLQIEMPENRNSSCTVCSGVNQKLDQAILALKPLLDELNVEIKKEIITIRTAQEARTHRITSSPTIRTGHFDLFPEHPHPESEQRIWTWKGNRYPEPTREILIEAILRGYLGKIEQKNQVNISPYVMQFFEHQAEPASADGCCS